MAQESSPQSGKNGKAPRIPADILAFQPDGVEIEHQPAPLMARITLYVLVTFIMAILVWACIAEVDKIVVTRGKVISTAPDVLVQPMVTSIVRQIHVQVGQVLKKDQILVTLDPTFAQADAIQLDQRIATLNLRIARLRAEIEGHPFTPSASDLPEEARLQERIYLGRQQEFAAKMHTYETAQQEQRAVIDEAAIQLRERRKQCDIFQEVEGLHEDLYSRGVQSRVEMLQAQNQVHSITVEISRLESTIQERRHALARIDEEKKAFFNNWLRETARELDETQTERESLVQQANKAQRMRELVHLTCPMDAVVLEAGDYAPGAVVKEGEPIMRLASLNATLEAEVEISAADIGYIRVNDLCRLKLDTFPFQRHGTLDGVLRVLSEDAFQVQSAPEKPLVYRGRIAVTSNELRQVPSDFRLLPGMTLVGEVKVGTRKVITYFIYPLIKMFDEGMRTP